MEIKMILNKSTICIMIVVLLLGLMGGFIIGQNVNLNSDNIIVATSDTAGTYKVAKYDIYEPAILILNKDGTCYFPGDGTVTWKQEGKFVIITRQYDFFGEETTSTYKLAIVDGGLYLGTSNKLFEKIN